MVKQKQLEALGAHQRKNIYKTQILNLPSQDSFYFVFMQTTVGLTDIVGKQICNIQCHFFHLGDPSWVACRIHAWQTWSNWKQTCYVEMKSNLKKNNYDIVPPYGHHLERHWFGPWYWFFISSWMDFWRPWIFLKNWNYDFQFRIWTEKLFLVFSSESELKSLYTFLTLSLLLIMKSKNWETKQRVHESILVLESNFKAW